MEEVVTNDSINTPHHVPMMQNTTTGDSNSVHSNSEVIRQ